MGLPSRIRGSVFWGIWGLAPAVMSEEYNEDPMVLANALRLSLQAGVDATEPVLHGQLCRRRLR